MMPVQAMQLVRLRLVQAALALVALVPVAAALPAFRRWVVARVPLQAQVPPPRAMSARLPAMAP